MSTEILLFKLNTNEELMAKIKVDNEDHYILDKPRSLAPMQAENGQVQLVFIPWMMGAQDPKSGFEAVVKLDKLAVIGTVIEPPEGLVKLYLSKTSGIDIFTG